MAKRSAKTDGTTDLDTTEAFEGQAEADAPEALDPTRTPDEDTTGDVEGTEEAPAEGVDPTMAAGMTPAADFATNGFETAPDASANESSAMSTSDATTGEVEPEAPASQDDGTCPPLALGAAEPEAPVALGADAHEDTDAAPADAGAGAPGAAAAPAAAEVAYGGAPVKQADDADVEKHIGGAVDSSGKPAKPMAVPVDPVTGVPLETLAHPENSTTAIFGGGQAPAPVSVTGQVPAGASQDETKGDEA